MQSVIFKHGLLKNIVQESLKLSETGMVRSGYCITKRFTSFKVQDIDDFNERVKNSKVPVIVDFFATWCNPCRMLTPRLESVIAEQKGKVALAKVDIDEHSDLALDYEVASVPVLIAMKNGKVEERLVGLQDEDKLRNFVNKFVKNSN